MTHASPTYAIIGADNGLSHVRKANILNHRCIIVDWTARDKFESNNIWYVHLRNYIWMCRLENSGHFVPASMSWDRNTWRHCGQIYDIFGQRVLTKCRAACEKHIIVLRISFPWVFCLCTSFYWSSERSAPSRHSPSLRSVKMPHSKCYGGCRHAINIPLRCHILPALTRPS